ncbi:SAM-dependent methyltransferase [Pseudoxanthomonas broegbernensis]|uniref:SAM-dependent methyltransferase n=1 Tax=Pseudoxanthomonas broegbernensis TaxID=83619 RepID=A0A7V8K7B8_9GAMM|nr:class I SAM-dependent methyltransferase [Pseudoxanthomonas broegbernensis]KAF1686930.1 SAM-dependent methyltransferase [Pseudoxanthomonas broegbernensis]MBB6065471.1 tRNA (cmo5U34)-methyltransferase [Pseudoxanthomonas broegbernensis]
MRREEIKAVFDQQAQGYDRQWARMAPIREGLHFLLESVFAGLPADARILCVGAGTGAELAHLAREFPLWTFTAVDPSGAMLEVCRRRAEEEGFASRCRFHEGYLDSLSIEGPYDAATCFLVSQFILERDARSAFFRGIAGRLRPGGMLASSDLAGEVGSSEYEALLDAWLAMMAAAGIPPEGLERMRAAYASDVAILPAATVASIIESGGFQAPARFFQAGLIHAWFSRRAAEDGA